MSMLLRSMILLHVALHMLMGRKSSPTPLLRALQSGIRTNEMELHVRCQVFLLTESLLAWWKPGALEHLNPSHISALFRTGPSKDNQRCNLSYVSWHGLIYLILSLSEFFRGSGLKEGFIAEYVFFARWQQDDPQPFFLGKPLTTH